jgi:hypothetical protein
MAKVTGPLFSLSASGKIANTLVYMKWKGLNDVRAYVIPANPNTAAQIAQRAIFEAAVDMVHAAQALAVDPLAALDIAAYNALAAVQESPRTWFNQFVKEFVDQRVAALKGVIFRDMVIAAGGAGEIDVDIDWTKEGANDITAGNWWFGLTPTAMIYSQAGTIAAGRVTDTITALTTGAKYFIQFRPTLHADFVGCPSGIYNCVAG